MSENTSRPPQQPSKASRNRARTRKDWSDVEQYLTGVEKSLGWAKSWALRERLERGDVTLKELMPR